MAISTPINTWDWRRNKPLWARHAMPDDPSTVGRSGFGVDEQQQLPQGNVVKAPDQNEQSGFEVARSVEQMAKKAQRGLPKLPQQVPDPLDSDEGFQRALGKSGAMTIGSKRSGRIGKSKAGATFSSGQFRGMTMDQARESWTSRNQSNLMPRVNRTPQEVAYGSPMHKPNRGAADGLPGQPASAAMDRFMRHLGGSPEAGAEGPSNSPAKAAQATSSVERMLGRANSGAAPGGDAIASSQTKSPSSGYKSNRKQNCRNGVCR